MTWTLVAETLRCSTLKSTRPEVCFNLHAAAGHSTPLQGHQKLSMSCSCSPMCAADICLQTADAAGMLPPWHPGLPLPDPRLDPYLRYPPHLLPRDPRGPLIPLPYHLPPLLPPWDLPPRDHPYWRGRLHPADPRGLTPLRSASGEPRSQPARRRGRSEEPEQRPAKRRAPRASPEPHRQGSD